MSKTEPVDYIIRLKRRRDWLHNRITSEGEKDLSFDKAELSALEWAIPILVWYISRKEEDDSPLHPED